MPAKQPVEAISKPFRVCIIDDDLESLASVQRVLGAGPCQVLTISTAIGSTNQLRKFKPHLIVMDIMMPGIDGDKLIELMRQALGTLPPFIFYSGIAPAELEKLARRHGASGFIYKGDGCYRLLSCINLHRFSLGLAEA